MTATTTPKKLWLHFIFILAATTLVCGKVSEGFIKVVHAGA